MGSHSINWNALEHHHGEKSPDWFWSVGIVSVAGAVLAIYFGNLLFALVILLSAFTSIMVSHTPPRLIGYEIGRRGIKIDETLFPYSSLESFWVIDEEVNDRIIIKSKKILMPYIVIPFDSAEVDADSIRDYLLEYLDEEELYEPTTQKIMERLGF